LTIPDFCSHIDRNQASWCLRDFNQDSFSPQHIELNQSQTLNKLTSFYFSEVELEHESEPDFNYVIQFRISNQCWLRYPYPIWTQFPSQHWFPYL